MCLFLSPFNIVHAQLKRDCSEKANQAIFLALAGSLQALEILNISDYVVVFALFSVFVRLYFSNGVLPFNVLP